MCKLILSACFFLAFSSACWSQEVPGSSSSPTPKEQMLSELDNLSQQISDLQTINDRLISLSDDQKKSLEAQSAQLRNFASSLNFTSLENSVLRWTSGGLLAVAVVEGVLLLVKR